MVHNTTQLTSNEVPFMKAIFTCLLMLSLLTMFILGISMTSEPAEARFPINNITLADDTATLNPSGHNVVVTGITQCTKGEIVEIEVRVNQDGVDATGKTHERCLGEDTDVEWTIHAATHGKESLNEGEAHVWAEARTYDKGKQTDEHDWDSDLTLEYR